MRSFIHKVAYNLRRPLPDLMTYLWSKPLSALWKSYLKQVGTGFQIRPGTRIEGGHHISIGTHFHGGPHLWLQAVQEHIGYEYEGVIVIGDHVSCSEFVHISANNRIHIDDGVLIGSRVHITDHSHGRYSGDIQDDPATTPESRELSLGRPVYIGKNVWLGDGVVVLPGVSIGAGTIVGANSVVSRSLPAQVIAVGVPASPIKKYDPTSGAWMPITKAE